LFQHKRITANAKEFAEFFGSQGSLRFYPTHIILVRGFSSAFESSQKWTYDYVHNFSASAGGGFSVFGINFGSSETYSSHEEQHNIDQSNTKLTFADGDSTLRFVGYVVQRNTVLDSSVLCPITEPGATAKALL
jgi:hypothetical protein